MYSLAQSCSWVDPAPNNVMLTFTLDPNSSFYVVGKEYKVQVFNRTTTLLFSGYDGIYSANPADNVIELGPFDSEMPIRVRIVTEVETNTQSEFNEVTIKCCKLKITNVTHQLVTNAATLWNLIVTTTDDYSSALQYSLNGGQTWQNLVNGTIPNKIVGSYTILVRNSRGCVDTYTYTFTDPDDNDDGDNGGRGKKDPTNSPYCKLAIQELTRCVKLRISGPSTLSYFYSHNGGQVDEIFGQVLELCNLVKGTSHTVQVWDGDGCNRTIRFTV